MKGDLCPPITRSPWGPDTSGLWTLAVMCTYPPPTHTSKITLMTLGLRKWFSQQSVCHISMFSLQNPWKKLGIVVLACDPGTGEAEQWIPGAYLSASLAYLASPRPWTTSSQKGKWIAHEEWVLPGVDLWLSWACVYTYMCTHTHVHPHIHVHPHKHAPHTYMCTHTHSPHTNK